LLEHGMVDMVVPRKDLKSTLERALRWFQHGADPTRRTGKVGDVVELELPQTD
jgi:acetyl-CoA carboxylase beta subunit